MRRVPMQDRCCGLEIVAHRCSKVPQRFTLCTVYVKAPRGTWRANKPLMKMEKHTECEFNGGEA